MDYNGGAAASAGLIAGAVMGLMLYLGMVISPRRMQMDLFYILGSFLAPNAGTPVVYMVGAISHAAMSLVLGLIYAVFFLPFSEGSNLVGWGVLYGLVHWIVVGLNLEGMGYIHPLRRASELRRLSAFAASYPRETVVGFLVLHLVFGLVVGGLYTAFN